MHAILSQDSPGPVNAILLNVDAKVPSSQISENSNESPTSSHELQEIKSQLSELINSVHNHQKFLDSEKQHLVPSIKSVTSTSARRYNVVVYDIEEPPFQSAMIVITQCTHLCRIYRHQPSKSLANNNNNTL